MKKTIWIPLVLGATLGIVDFISLAVDFLIPLGPFGATGPQEIFLTISAALGGPLGLVVASFLQDLGIYTFFLKTQLSPEQMPSAGVIFAIADLAAHLLALLVVAYCYKYLHRRAKKVYIFFAGWILIVVIYYTLLVPLQSLMLGFVVQDIPPLSVLFQRNLPEFLVVLIITTIIWIALPGRYHRPLWIEFQPAASPNANKTMHKELGT